MNRREFLVAAGSVAVAGCNAPGNNDGGGGSNDGDDGSLSEPRVEWDTGGVDAELEPGDDPVVEAYAASRDVLAVAGIAQLPNPCHEVRLDDWAYDSAGRTIEVRLEAVDTSSPDEMCAEVIEYEEYVFLIRNADAVDRLVIDEPAGERYSFEPVPGK